MKKFSLVLTLILACFISKAQFQSAQKLDETFSTDDNLITTVDMDMTNGLAQIGQLRPATGSLSTTPSNSNTATRMHFTHLNAITPSTVINKVILPMGENPFYLDDNKAYYPTEIRKIDQGYIICGHYEEGATCYQPAVKAAFMMKVDNNGTPLIYKAYTISGNYNDHIVLNSVAPVNDGAIVHGFVACGYKWDNTNSRTKAIIVIVDENLSVLATKEVNETAIYVSELNANVYPSSYYNQIDRYNDNELFLVGSSGVVSVAAPSAPDGLGYLRGDVLFTRCSTNVTIRPATPIILTSVNLYSLPNDVVEMGVSLVQGNNYYAGADYIIMMDHIADQFTGANYTSRNSTIVFHGIGNVHTPNYSLWAFAGINGRIDYQNTPHERGTDLLLDGNNNMYMLCSYDGVSRPIESQVFVTGAGDVSVMQGDDYMGALGGDLVPRDLESDAGGRVILTHSQYSPYVEKILPLGYTSDPNPPHCKGNYHYTINFRHNINKGPSKTHLTPSISACEVLMLDHDIPVTTLDPCVLALVKPNTGELPQNKKQKSTQLADVKVYPNPANTGVTFEFTEDIPTASKLEIISVNGQVLVSIDNVDTKTNGNSVAVDISTLADGVYFCTVTSPDGKQLQTRFQKTTGK